MEKPKYPNDLEELKQIEKLINKIDVFREKLSKLDDEIKYISQKSYEASNFINKQEIEGLIYKSFFQDVENKPFNSEESKDINRLKAEIVWDGVIFKRNVSCEICGENRSIDKCHIIPNRTGGLKEDNNLLYLCPTHHRLFDRFMLTKKEWCSIDWDRKEPAAQAYAETVTLDAHKKFWERIENSEFSRIPMYEIKEEAFVEFVIKEILELFIERKPMKSNNIKKMLNSSIQEVAGKIIRLLINEGVIHKICENKNELLFLPEGNKVVDSSVVKRIWQKIG